MTKLGVVLGFRGVLICFSCLQVVSGDEVHQCSLAHLHLKRAVESDVSRPSVSHHAEAWALSALLALTLL